MTTGAGRGGPWSAWAVAAAVFAWLAATAWMRPLMLPDEGRYVGVAWEMMSSGRWAVPLLDGLPFFHKPPLFYWLSAASMKLFGATAWAGRMPSLLGATLAAGSLHAFTRRWGGEALARTATLLLAVAPFFCLGAQYANLDMLVAGCIAATVLLGAQAALLAANALPFRAPLWAAYAMAAIGVLAKGLIGFVLPGAVLLAWLLATRRPALILKLLSVPGLLILLAIASPWFLWMQKLYPGFYDYFFVYQHFQRFATAGFNNEQAPWFYLWALPVLCLPVSLLWAGLFSRAARERLGAALKDTGAPSIAWLMVCWLAVIVVFFSLPRSKLVGYVLPAVPPFCWLLAQAALQLDKPRLLRGVVAGAVLLNLVAVGFVAFKYDRSNRSLAQALRAQYRPGDPVLAFDHYPYDLAFLARLQQPVVSVGDWQDPAIAQRDDWRKELVDAGRFDEAAAARQLLRRDAAATVMCSASQAWLLVGSRQSPPAVPPGTLQEVARNRDLVLLRFSCGGRPSGG